MNIAIEEVSACRRRLRIEVPASRVAEELAKVTGEFQKFAQIKGFRAGKAPKSVIEKRYEKDIEEEVKRKMIPQAFREAVKSKNLKVVSMPSVEELSFSRGVSLSFSTVVDLVPEFSLPEYKGLKVKKAESTVSDTDINGVIDRIRDQSADYKTVEGRPVQEKDFAVINYEGSIDGKPISELVPDVPNLGKQEKFWLLIQDGLFLPGFSQQLIGANPGETRTVTVQFPENFPQEPVRGKTAEYRTTLEEIKEKILPELNDDFARTVAQCTAEELKERVRKNLEQQKQEQARNEHLKQIFEQLRDKTQFDLPESSVQNQTRRLVYDIVRENEMRGIPSNVLEEKKQDIFSAAETSAKDQVKLGFILSRIAEAEKIDVKTDEVIAEIGKLSARQNVPPQKLIKQLQENDGIAALEDELLNRKTVDFLLQSAIIE